MLINPDELEAHIASCARLIESAMARYEQSNCFTDRADADVWRRSMETAIKARTPETVARMEAERGLA